MRAAQESQGAEGEDNLSAELQMVHGGVFERHVPGRIKFERRWQRAAQEKAGHKNQDETRGPTNPSGGLEEIF